ncbi:hypothetical protein [Streptomyces goshikiensis]|uniref:hypothetical protein n=1 Tax=Streptomyces goshikiensis TaxID=1942 RepID=UPI0036503548
MFESGIHFRPLGFALTGGLASTPFTGLVCGSGVFGGTHTLGGFSAASTTGRPRPEKSTATTAVIATRDLPVRERTKNPLRRNNRIPPQGAGNANEPDRRARIPRTLRNGCSKNHRIETTSAL